MAPTRLGTRGASATWRQSRAALGTNGCGSQIDQQAPGPGAVKMQGAEYAPALLARAPFDEIESDATRVALGGHLGR